MIYLGADHRGFKLKEEIKAHLRSANIEFQDLGNSQYDEEDDYPIFSAKVAQAVSLKDGAKGILICGSGAGVCVVANKFERIRAALGAKPEQIKSMRADDDINILCLAADFIDKQTALKLVDEFLNTPFKGGEKYERRLEEIKSFESGDKHNKL